MGEVISLSAAYNKRHNPEKGNLLTFRSDYHTKGKFKVRVTGLYLKSKKTKIGYTDFVETYPGYVFVYLPSIGFIEIAKQRLTMEE
jgi:hypothetical protein